ncbi:hypothetical protein ACFL0I_03810, partial [Gemmatimonadota bacterium]
MKKAAFLTTLLAIGCVSVNKSILDYSFQDRPVPPTRVTCPHLRYQLLSHTFPLFALGVRSQKSRQIQERWIRPDGSRSW